MNFFDSVNLLHFNLHKISLNRAGSYTDSPKWLKNKTSTINLKNNDNKCFQLALTHKKDWKKFELNNKSIAPNVFYVPYNTEEIRHACNSRNNLKHENQVIHLIISDSKK